MYISSLRRTTADFVEPSNRTVLAQAEWRTVAVPASCRAELQCRGEGGWLWSHIAPGYLLAVLAQIVHAACLVVMLFSVPPEWEDEETQMLREKWERGGPMSTADWNAATIGALRMQCVWRGFMDRRRMFYHREYVQCGSTQMERLRCALSALTYAIMTSYIAFTTYLCLRVKFSPTEGHCGLMVRKGD